MTEETEVALMLGNMLKLANEKGVEPTEFTEKIARVRVRLGIPISVCPCASKDTERGCISTKCMKEIKELGQCHCCAFQLKGNKDVKFNKSSSAL